MAIKAVVTADEHAKLDDAIKALYKQEGTVFVLDADGIDAHPATRSLKNALDTERNNASNATRELAKLREQLGSDDPAEAAEALRKIKDMEEKAALGEIPEKFKQQFDKAVAVRVESITKNYEAQKKGYEKQIAELNDGLNKTNSQLEELTIDGEVRNVAAKKGLNDWAVEDAILHARRLYKLKDGKPVPLNGDQIVFSGKRPGDPKPIEEWLEEKVAEKPGWLKPNAGAGADNGGQRKGGGGSGQFVLTREQARDPKTYNRMRDEAAKVGQEVMIAEQ